MKKKKKKPSNKSGNRKSHSKPRSVRSNKTGMDRRGDQCHEGSLQNRKGQGGQHAKVQYSIG